MTQSVDAIRQAYQKNVLKQAISLGAKQTLPLHARSLTVEEVAAMDRLFYPVILGIFWAGALPLLIWLYLSGDTGSPDLFLIVLACVILLTVPLWLFARFKAGRRSAYRDPQVSMEIGDTGIRFGDTRVGASAGNDIAYADLNISSFIFQRGAKSSALFLGIILESPSGPLSLENRQYKQGTRAAAAIIAQRTDKGLPALSTTASPQTD